MRIAPAVGVVGALAMLVACASASTPEGSLRTCNVDFDCGAGAYCTEASLCRADCFTDDDCLGPDLAAQCNAHGRCVSADATLEDGGGIADAGSDDGETAADDAFGDDVNDEAEVGP